MNEQELAEKVCEISRLLMKKGLVARTWGNTSIRASNNTFLITPSGLPYETLDPSEIVLVSLSDLSVTGDIKPSSEKNLHQAIYLQFPDTNGIIHTHQPFASSFAAARIDLPGESIKSGILQGKTIACAPYSLPTTKKLANAVARGLEEYSTPVLFLANHGAVCWGKSLEEALQVAEELEIACENYIMEAYKKMSGFSSGGNSDLLAYYVNQVKEA